MIEYPFLAFKTYSPVDNEIAIYHLASNCPLSIFNLGKNMELISFVDQSMNIAS